MTEVRTLKEKAIEPVHVSDTCWLYGEHNGLTVVQEYRDAVGNHITTLTVTIPWADVSRARGRRPMSKD